MSPESANQESPAEEVPTTVTSEKPESESEVSEETEETSRGHEEETRKGTEEKDGSADQGPETNGPDSAAGPPQPQTHQVRLDTCCELRSKVTASFC